MLQDVSSRFLLCHWNTETEELYTYKSQNLLLFFNGPLLLLLTSDRTSRNGFFLILTSAHYRTRLDKWVLILNDSRLMLVNKIYSHVCSLAKTPKYRRRQYLLARATRSRSRKKQRRGRVELHTYHMMMETHPTMAGEHRTIQSQLFFHQLSSST